ncbi:MAG: endonuclease III [Candidatus Dojkabacteria bacterium]|nr:endonuclease III [Candidatus Dojkabacteria bacterium]
MIRLRKKQVEKIKDLLKREYINVVTPLKHENAFQLLIATILSAQTLDDTVNKVTRKLFQYFPTVEVLAKASFDEVDKIINIINYHRTKAKNIIDLASKILEKYDGHVPYKIEDLVQLPGVGRKTANVVISEWFSKPLSCRGNRFDICINKPFNFTQNVFVDPGSISQHDSIYIEPQGFVVDTHVKRVAIRLGLSDSEKVENIEKDLMSIFPKSEWPEMSLRLIFHGRYKCKAKVNMCKNDKNWASLCIYGI